MSLMPQPAAPYIVAEIGPNFCVSADREENELALIRLIDTAAIAGADAIKLQLKSLEPGGYYSREDLDREVADHRSPFRTRREFVMAREPDEALLALVDDHCGSVGLEWSASPWDLPSVELLSRFDVPWVKVASASITDLDLLAAVRGMAKPVILSTGMSTLEEVDRAVEALSGVPHLTLLHCVSTYPCDNSEIDLSVMETLRDRYGLPVGYSGHERGIQISVAAAALSASVIERHITLDRTAWGPDHAASLEPDGLIKLVRDCRIAWRAAHGSGVKRVLESEIPHRARLRRA
jgi:N-acetylneuraminate synthase